MTYVEAWQNFALERPSSVERFLKSHPENYWQVCLQEFLDKKCKVPPKPQTRIDFKHLAFFNQHICFSPTESAAMAGLSLADYKQHAKAFERQGLITTNAHVFLKRTQKEYAITPLGLQRLQSNLANTTLAPTPSNPA